MHAYCRGASRRPEAASTATRAALLRGLHFQGLWTAVCLGADISCVCGETCLTNQDGSDAHMFLSHDNAAVGNLFAALHKHEYKASPVHYALRF